MGANEINQPLRKVADACIHCGLCLDACPTYAEIGSEADSPRGRVYLMRALLEGRIEPTADITVHLDNCLGCRACETACPSGVAYGFLLEGVRARITEPGRQAGLRSIFWRFIIRRVLPNRHFFRFAIWPLRLFARGDRRWLPGGIAVALDMVGRPTSQRRWPPFTRARGKRIGRAGFLPGCAMPVLFPQVNEASVQLVAQAGFDVFAPLQALCCGALQAHDGDERGARRRQMQIMETFRDCDIIVTNSAGCGASLKDSSCDGSRRVRDLSEVLQEWHWQPTRSLVGPSGRQLRVAYHDPCHLAHGQGIRAGPRELLRRAGAVVIELDDPDYCCGGAGSFALLKPQLSNALMLRKVDSILARKPDVVVTGNPSCLMQLDRGLRSLGSMIPVQHLAEVLAIT